MFRQYYPAIVVSTMRLIIAYIIIISTLVLVCSGVVRAQLAVTPDIIITELQTSGKTASEEFIELYNITSHDIDLADVAHQGKNIWKMQFFSTSKVASSNFNWDPKASGLTTISFTRADNTPVLVAAHSYFIVAAAGYKPGDVEPDFTYASGHMSDAGGGVQLVDISGLGTLTVIVVHDHLGWFSPTNSSPMSTGLYLTPPSGASLQRTPVAEGYGSTDSLPAKYISSATITPKEAWTSPIEQLPESSLSQQSSVLNIPTSQANEKLQATSEQLLPIQITELLPNPASPQADDKDEYVELFNPNNQIINLNGYSLQTGLKFSYSYTIQNLSIEPLGYVNLTSSDTHIPLSNTAGQAQLLNTFGQVVSQTGAYGAAPAGQAWALQAGVWHWTIKPTPAAQNIINQPIDNVAQTNASPLKSPVKLGSPKAVVQKTSAVSKPRIPAVKAPKKVKPSAVSKGSKTGINKSQPASLHMAILVGVALAAVIYGLYEYRKDISNKFYQLRAYRAARRASRLAS